MKYNDYDYIMQMIDYCKKVNQILSQAKSYSINLSDEMVIDALAMNIGQIGEQLSSKKLSKELQNSYDLPWSQIKKFRDKAYHHYGSMDYKIILDISINYIPILLNDLLIIKLDLEKNNKT